MKLSKNIIHSISASMDHKIVKSAEKNSVVFCQPYVLAIYDFHSSLIWSTCGVYCCLIYVKLSCMEYFSSCWSYHLFHSNPKDNWVFFEFYFWVRQLVDILMWILKLLIKIPKCSLWNIHYQMPPRLGHFSQNSSFYGPWFQVEPVSI